MARGWKQYLDDFEVGRRDRLLKTEKFKKQARSNRGRTIDDWLVDADFAEGSEKSEALQTRLAKLYEKGFRRGRVIEVHKRNVFVAGESEQGKPNTGDLWLCSVAKRHFQRAHKERNFVVVGDRVLFVPDSDIVFDETGEPVDTDLPRGAIQHAFVRTSRIARNDPHRPDWEHVMLANIDAVVIVASVFHPEVRWGLIDRFLVQAEYESLTAIIVLNKVDLLANEKLANPEFLKKYARRVAIYREIGYEVIEVCALKPQKTPEAVTRLRDLFKGKLMGLAGHSGVGKSSILNLMQPEFEQIVDDNPEIFYKGRHTTTYNSLLTLGIGAYAIDTPGVRSFAIDGLDSITLSGCFREFHGLRCKYRECSHDKEPECAVKDAVAQGKVAAERYRSYIGILKGVSFREGEGDDRTSDGSDSGMIADLRARAQSRDEVLAGHQRAVDDGTADPHAYSDPLLEIVAQQRELAEKERLQKGRGEAGMPRNRLARLKSKSSAGSAATPPAGPPAGPSAEPESVTKTEDTPE